MIFQLLSSQRLTLTLINPKGTRRQSGFWKGQFHDLKCFGLLSSEHNL